MRDQCMLRQASVHPRWQSWATTLKRSAPVRFALAAGSSSLKRTVSSSSCSLCSDNRFRNDGCIADTHYCMDGVDAQQVICWLEATLT